MSDSWGDSTDQTTTDHADDVLVRPKGYVEPFPVVRRIGDRECYIGNEAAADGTGHDRRFEFVLSVSTDAHSLTTHHRPLRDGPGNEWEAFEQAVDTARELFRRDGSLLVNCRAGISRSSTVLATMLAAEEGRRFRDAIGRVQQARPAAMPHPALHELAVVYLAATA
ncbi:protein-tyrosine phosphatase family protein [Haloarchaeobius amylolyticus]|uniref:protein-tyrosine phosphatase family protein n=1 Tax=Haloarchaeobius amylolyticus TaxID=1198296 RepID=UPI00226F3DCE|nr:dual specificity protein phosphatase [Haloarchaeobius amylolyticus]